MYSIIGLRSTLPVVERFTTKHFGGQLQVSSSSAVYEEPLHVTEPIHDGLRIIVFLSGDTTIRTGDSPVRIQSPSSLAVFSEGDSPREQSFERGILTVSVLLHVDRDLIISELGRDPADILAQGPCSDGPLMRLREADGAVRAVAAQIVKAPQDQSGFFRCGKALELAGLILDGFQNDKGRGSIFQLSLDEVDRVRQAHDLLVQSIANPPSVETLSRQCGTNAAKLSRGFRTVYGMTPYAYLQERRLRHAFDLLSTGQATVGQVARSVGYGQTHFATLFRRRFDISPSALLIRMNPQQPGSER